MIKKALNILEGFFYTWGFEINMWTLNSWLTELDIRYQCYYLDLMSSCILWMEIAYCTTHWDYNIPCNLLKNCIRVKVVTVFIWSNIVVPFFFLRILKILAVYNRNCVLSAHFYIGDCDISIANTNILTTIDKKNIIMLHNVDLTTQSHPEENLFPFESASSQCFPGSGHLWLAHQRSISYIQISRKLCDNVTC